MSDPTTLARSARESLAKGLNALQSDPNVPPELVELGAPIAQAMGALHQIERSQGAQLVPHADTALLHVRTALSQLQAPPNPHAAVVAAMEAVAASLGMVHALSKMAAGPAGPQPPQAPQAQQAPAPQAQPAPAPQQPQQQPQQPPRPGNAAPAPVAATGAPHFPQPAANGPQPFQPPAQPQHQPQPPQQFQPQPVHQQPQQQPMQQPPQQFQPQPVHQQPQQQPIQQQPPQQFQPQPAHQQPLPQPMQQPPQAGFQQGQPMQFQPTMQQPPMQQHAQQQAFAGGPQPGARPPQGGVDPFAARPAGPQGAPAPGTSIPSPAPQGNQTPIDAALGAHSATNFYKGLSGNDIIDHGGLFVATYMVPKIGAPVRLRVSLPGGYEFEANAIVKWSRESADPFGESQPGFGAQFTQISPEARQLVYRYVRNREPLFHDDL